jgi:hypothetical protein
VPFLTRLHTNGRIASKERHSGLRIARPEFPQNPKSTPLFPKKAFPLDLVGFTRIHSDFFLIFSRDCVLFVLSVVAPSSSGNLANWIAGALERKNFIP